MTTMFRIPVQSSPVISSQVNSDTHGKEPSTFTGYVLTKLQNHNLPTR